LIAVNRKGDTLFQTAITNLLDSSERGSPVFLNAQNRTHQTMLMLFAVHNHHGIVNYLISVEPDVSLIDYNHRTMLHYIFIRNSLSSETSPELTTAIRKEHSALLLSADNTGKILWIFAVHAGNVGSLGVIATYFPSAFWTATPKLHFTRHLQLGAFL
jgi:hypothetical protein